MNWTTNKISILAIVALAATSATVDAAKPKFKIGREQVTSLSPEMQREIGALQYVLNPYQLRQFFSLPSDSLRREWIDAYWRALDPTPTTPKNEMMVEHYVRVRMAMQFFEVKSWPGWDKRGEVFIRYGPPNYRGKIHAEVTARKVHPPGELWFYRKHMMVVQFEDFNLDGHYNYAIKPLGVARGMDPELMEFLIYDTEDALQEQIPDYLLNIHRPTEMINDPIDWADAKDQLEIIAPRSAVNPRMRGMSEGMDEIVNPDTKYITPGNPSYAFQNDRVREYANNFEVALEEAPSSYPFNFEDTSFPFYFAVDQFKGGEGVNRVEVNVEFPADLSEGEEALPSKTYIASAVFLDSEFNEIASESREITLPTTPVDPDDEEVYDDEEEHDSKYVRLVPAQLLFTLPQDYYRLAVAVAESHSDRSTAYRTTVAYNDYRHDLVISDIMFASKISPAERQSPFNRGALEVVPHPLQRYRRTESVPVYFEIYNLELDDDGLSQYTVEYHIVPASPNKSSFWDVYDNESPIVASRFESSGYGSTDPLYVSIDTDNLREGFYSLLVTVTDEMTQGVTFRKATFQIVE